MRRTAATPGPVRAGSAPATPPPAGGPGSRRVDGDPLVVVPGFDAGRLLARGGVRTVALVHPAGASGASGAAPTRVPLVAVVARDDGEQRRRVACAAALTTVYGAPLVDVVSFGRGTQRMLVPLYAYVRTTPLARVLGRDREPRPGEVCTLGIALARACAEFGDAGWERRRLALADVALDEVGRPRLFGTGGAARIPDGGERAARGRMAQLVEVVVTTLGLDLGDAPVPPGSDALAVLEQRLFDAAEPVPLGVPDTGAVAVAARAGGDPGAAQAARRLEPTPRVRAAATALLGDRAEEVLAQGAGALERVRLVARALRRRGRLVIGGAATAALLAALALLFLPAQPTPAGPPPAAASASPSSTVDASGAAHRGAASVPPRPGAAGAAEPDPATAALALLRMRAACLRDDDAACVAALVEPGSPAALAPEPTATPGAANTRSAAALAGATSRVITRAGGAALVEITPERDQPVSVLVVRGETGWRLRAIDADRSR